MTSLHPSELDSCATDSVTSSPRSDHFHHGGLSQDPRVRFMCSFGGKILPRPHDNQLRYVGGDTRIVAVHRSLNLSTLLTKLSKLSGIINLSVKYQLPNEDLDALISVTTDEDLENMLDEYDRVSQNLNPRSARLRLFLFGEDHSSRTSSISSLLDGSTNREHWFLDALNSGAAATLERGRSEASSIVSEVPDYLFGLDTSDENPPIKESKLKTRPVLNDNVTASDPGSPAPVVPSPFCSTSSASVPVMPSIPDLPPVKTKPDNPDPFFQPKALNIDEQPIGQIPAGYSGNPVMQYIPDSHYPGPPVQRMPVYYVPTPVPVQPGNAPVQIRPTYVPQYQVPMGQMQVGYHQQVPDMGQIYGASAPGLRPMAAMDPHDAGRMVAFPDGINQQVYYGVRGAGVGMVPGYIGAGGDDFQRNNGSDPKSGRVSLS